MKLFPHLLFLIILFITISCKLNSSDDPTPSGNNADSLIPLSDIENSSDYTYTATTNTIKLNGTSIAVSGTGASVAGSTVTITTAGTYAISGTLTNGQIKVQTDSQDPVKLVLSGIDVTNTTTSPIFIDKARKVVLFLEKGTTNKVADATAYKDTTEGQNATIYSQAYLAITGDGTLQVTGKYADGIGAKEGLVINGGNIVVNAKDEGIRGKDYLVVRDGTLDVTTTLGDGLKSDYENDDKYGYIQIDKGTIKVNAKGDGISAYTSVVVNAGILNITAGGGSSSTVIGTASAKGIKGLKLVKLAATSATVNSADDAIHSNVAVTIEKGTYSLSTADDGIHGNAIVTIQDGNITIAKAYEGIEAKTITIEKGEIKVTSSNDAINSTAGTRTEQNDGSFVYIKGGTLVLDALQGDPLDSNGSLSMSDGTIIVHGPQRTPEVPIDYNGTFVVTKGMLVASGPGTTMFQVPSTTSTINSLKLTFKTSNAAGTLFNIQDENGQSLVTFKPSRAYLVMAFTSDKLQKDKTYKIYTGGSVVGGTDKGGYYTAGTYSGGTLKGSVTVSSSVTSATLN